MKRVSKQKKIPPLLQSMKLRVPLLIAMMTFMVIRLSANPGSLFHWGRVFWMMCVVTTLIGIVLAVFYRRRTWCSICPMGTMQRLIGRHKKELTLDSNSCSSCKICEKKCPSNLNIIAGENKKTLKDCLKCSICVDSCPKKALSWSSEVRKVS